MFGAGFARDLTRKAVAAATAAAAAFVAVAALGATVFYALSMIMSALAAAALTGLLFAIVAGVVVMVFIRRDGAAAAVEDDDEPVGLGQRAFTLFRERPIMGAVAALAGGFIFLRNPALATMVAAAFTEKSHSRRRRY